MFGDREAKPKTFGDKDTIVLIQFWTIWLKEESWFLGRLQWFWWLVRWNLRCVIDIRLFIRWFRRRSGSSLLVFWMKIYRELSYSRLVGEYVPLDFINQNLSWRLFPELLIFIVIVDVIPNSQELLTHVRTCQQQHRDTYDVFLADLWWIRRISL